MLDREWETLLDDLELLAIQSKGNHLRSKQVLAHSQSLLDRSLAQQTLAGSTEQVIDLEEGLQAQKVKRDSRRQTRWGGV